jgi:hypothetical protein
MAVCLFKAKKGKRENEKQNEKRKEKQKNKNLGGGRPTFRMILNNNACRCHCGS